MAREVAGAAVEADGRAVRQGGDGAASQGDGGQPVGSVGAGASRSHPGEAGLARRWLVTVDPATEAAGDGASGRGGGTRRRRDLDTIGD